MPCKKDHSDEILWIYPPRGDEEGYWCKDYGNIKIPRGWAFLPAGDAFTTRTVKAMGSHWLEVKAAKGYTRKLGIWAPEKHIDAAIKQAQETQEQRQNKRIVYRKLREKQEAKYRDQFAEAVFITLILLRDIENWHAKSLRKRRNARRWSAVNEWDAPKS